jgi:hypothetical protein
MACLEKTRAKRPQTARDLTLLLARCAAASAWSIEEADAWWGRHERDQERLSTGAGSPDSPRIPPTSTGVYDKTFVSNADS